MYINNYEIVDSYIGPKNIIKIYIGSKMTWEKITELMSCYANGYWMDEYPWTDNTPWNN
jgi:hypothetical protein